MDLLNLCVSYFEIILQDIDQFTTFPVSKVNSQFMYVVLKTKIA